MDIAQLAQMVTWLDEEHRRDRAEIARLQQRVESQEADIIEQARRIQELEGRIAAQNSQMGRFSHVENIIDNTRQELIALIEKGDENRGQGQRELERARLSDRETIAREISEVRRELPRIARVEEALTSRAVEDERLADLIMGVRAQIGSLAKEIEERTRQIPFLAEQRTSDTKRIAQLQQETVEIFKRIEAQAGRVSVFEEGIRKVTAAQEKLPPQIETLREEQQKFMERVRAALVEREQTVNRWQEVINEQKTLIGQTYERIQSFTQQIEGSRRAVQEMKEFKDVILREQSQVQELQRLAEERIRREMDEFREEYDKRRRRDELRQEHLWSEQEKYNASIIEKFPPIHHDLRLQETLIEKLWKMQESYTQYYLDSAQSMLEGLQESIRDRDESLKNMEELWERQQRSSEIFATQNNVRRVPGIITGEAPEPQNGNVR